MTAMRSELKMFPALDAPDGARFDFRGVTGARFAHNLDQWLLIAPLANPAMLQIFRDRDRQPRRDLVPWAGEFAGKYLTSAVLALRMTGAERLRDTIGHFVQDLIATQDTDGYLGPAPRDQRLTGKTLNGDWLWDVWGHYHCMLGLLLWYQESGDAAALAACRTAADLVCQRFLDTQEKVSSAGAEEMNMAVSHSLCLLHELTGEAKYLRMAQAIEREWETPPAGDYVRTALAGQEFYATPKPRWESLHDIQAIAELYFISGDAKYRQAFEHIWWSIAKGDRHNAGGFSSGEAAVGNPYDPHAIETCCTIAWVALSVDMLRMSGSSLVADEIELSTFNGILGAQHPSGRWWTYNTPMDGVRKASAHEIVFQAREGSPELNCCSVNGPRGLGMLSEWAVMQAQDGLAINYYGPCTSTLTLPSGNALTLVQTTTYPLDGQVALAIKLARPEHFTMRLRIPAWSHHTRLSVNAEDVAGVTAGQYFGLEREWRDGDELRLSLDMSPHVWVGEREAAGMVSVYHGPLLLAYDRQHNELDPNELPVLTPQAIRQMAPQRGDGVSEPWILLRVEGSRGKALVLCDFAGAGAAGTPYRTWLPAEGFIPQPFARERPVWCAPLP
ncbi:MAG: glycoside hydrolase family 127 protein [Chloroflexi bacterium]|nr:glycoside hydrolase family 127 protein [Chloroflexota bacterium]